MRLVIDLQACQSPSGRVRGVGRYCLSLSLAMSRVNQKHEVWIATNGAMPESVINIREYFSGVVPPERIVSWESIGPTASMDEANRSRSLAAECLREQFLESLGADVILTASMIDGYADSVVTSVRERSPALQVAILFDLIPLLMPDIYLAREGVAAWYMRKLGHLQRCDLLLGISDFTSKEGVHLLELDANRVINISAAVGDDFRRLQGEVTVGRKFGISRPFVMYAGGFDPRKNLDQFIHAYAQLPALVRGNHQLVFVGGIGSVERDALNAVRVECGLVEEELIFTGFVSDVDLVRLYNACAVYAFPSTHEGFGLPALEAMSCGAVVIGSCTTSLPEVIGCEEALFDPYDIISMRDKLHQSLKDDAFRQRMRDHATQQVGRFSWSASAKLAWEAIENALVTSTRPLGVVEEQPIEELRRVAVLATGNLDLAHFKGFTGTGRVDVFGDEAHSTFRSAKFPLGWKRHPLASFDASVFDDVLLQVRDVPETVDLLVKVRNVDTVLLLEDSKTPQVFERLRFVNPGLLATMLYVWQGYAAVDGKQDNSFTSVPSNVLALGSASWLAIPLANGRYERPAERLISDLSSLPGIETWGDDDMARLASAVAANAPARHVQRTLYVDISQLVLSDAGTGIQRVVRHIVAELMVAPPEGFRVEPVYIEIGDVFRYARSYSGKRFHPDTVLPGDTPVAFKAGDIFLGLDLAAHLVPATRDHYMRMRSRGVDVQFVVYDLLPLLRPECFDDVNLPIFRAWYEAIAELADGVICISKTVAGEFTHWLSQAMPKRSSPLRIGWFHLGADLVSQRNLILNEVPVPLVRVRPTFLMVGTIEPRKGHAQAIAAFEELWRRGVEVNLIILGKAGWRVDTLLQRLRRHEQLGGRLFWFEDATDAELVGMYQGASALLAASEGEGFGLPLIEAAQYGTPILARDLDVFKEVAGKHAFYFQGTDPNALADAVEAWLAASATGAAPSSAGMPWLTWRDSAQQLLGVAVGGNWPGSWMPNAIRRFGASDYRAQATTGALVRGRRESIRERGVLYATPPFEVGPGHYEVIVRGERHSPIGEAWIDVDAADGSWRFASVALTCGEGVIGSVEVHIDEDVSDMRLRVRVDGEVEVKFVSIELEPVIPKGSVPVKHT